MSDIISEYLENTNTTKEETAEQNYSINYEAYLLLSKLLFEDIAQMRSSVRKMKKHIEQNGFVESPQQPSAIDFKAEEWVSKNSSAKTLYKLLIKMVNQETTYLKKELNVLEKIITSVHSEG